MIVACELSRIYKSGVAAIFDSWKQCLQSAWNTAVHLQYEIQLRVVGDFLPGRSTLPGAEPTRVKQRKQPPLADVTP